MKIGDLVSKLQTSGRVEFGPTQLSGPMGVMVSLADSLAKVLAPEVQVFDGVILETSKEQGGAEVGRSEWLLLVQGYLLRLVAEEQDKTVQDRTLTVSHTVYPLSTLRRVGIVTGHRQEAAGAYFHSYAS